MKATLAALFLLMSLRQVATAQGFAPPQAYPIDRYEQGWQKNPFTPD